MHPDIQDDASAPEGGCLPLVLGYGPRTSDQVLADVDPFFDVAHLLRAGAVALAYASVISLAFIGAAHVARTFVGLGG